MQENNTDQPTVDPTPMFFFHFKLVAKLAACVGGISTLGWATVVFYLTSAGGESYFDVVRAFSITEQKLAPVMWASGFLLIGIIGFITWGISLYSSFRIAGPLFRFSRNLEMVCDKGPVPVLGIRETDKLQEESKLLVASVDRLATHYNSMAAIIERAEVLIDSKDPDDTERLEKTLRRLKELEAHVQL